MKPNTRLTKTFIGLMALAAVACSVYASLTSHALHTFYALAILALAGATSRMKIKLPGIDGNMSVNLPFLLMAVVNLSAVEAVLIASISTVVQCWPNETGKFKPEQMLFNVSMMAFATSMANLIWNAGWLGKAAWASEPLMLASANAAFFVGQTAPVAGIRRGFAPRLARHRAALIPLLRSQRGHDLHGQHGQPSLWLAGSLGGLPGHVWNSSLVPVVLWPGLRSAAHGPISEGSQRGSVRELGRSGSFNPGGVLAATRTPPSFLLRRKTNETAGFPYSERQSAASARTGIRQSGDNSVTNSPGAAHRIAWRFGPDRQGSNLHTDPPLTRTSLFRRKSHAASARSHSRSSCPARAGVHIQRSSGAISTHQPGFGSRWQGKASGYPAEKWLGYRLRTRRRLLGQRRSQRMDYAV